MKESAIQSEDVSLLVRFLASWSCGSFCSVMLEVLGLHWFCKVGGFLSCSICLSACHSIFPRASACDSLVRGVRWMNGRPCGVCVFAACRCAWVLAASQICH